MECLEALDANSWKQEAEWEEKTIKELDKWCVRQVGSSRRQKPTKG